MDTDGNCDCDKDRRNESRSGCVCGMESGVAVRMDVENTEKARSATGVGWDTRGVRVLRAMSSWEDVARNHVEVRWTEKGLLST